MLAPTRKRLRSPSPPPDQVTSPLDILLKRRRQYSYPFSDSTEDNLPYDPSHTQHDPDQPGPSSWSRFVEKRRTRQWEKLNNPSSSQPFAHHVPDQMMYHDDGSPIRPRWQSQPEPAIAPMSSSPVRHDAPTSSPFRMNNSQSQSTKVGEDMNEDEMRREWGEEYYSQNALLRRLHMARAAPPDAHEHSTNSDTSLLQTPSLPDVASPSIYNQPSTFQTPYRNSYFPPSSPLIHDPNTTVTPLHPTYRNDSHHFSSPFPSQTNAHYSQQSYRTPGGQDEPMETLMTPDRPVNQVEEEVRHRYEETNRLLAELAMVRQQRWGHEGFQ